MNFKKFRYYPRDAKKTLKTFPRIHYSTWSNYTFYGVSSSKYFSRRFSSHICFGDLFSKFPSRGKNFDKFRQYVVTVGLVHHANLSKSLINRWLEFAFNAYPGLKKHIEFHRDEDGTIAGYSVDMKDVPPEPMFHTMQLVRATIDNPETVRFWDYLFRNGVHPFFATWIAHRIVSHTEVISSNPVQHETPVVFTDLGRDGGHTFMPSSIDLKDILTGDIFKKIDSKRRLSDRDTEKNTTEILSLVVGDFDINKFKKYFKWFNETDTMFKFCGIEVFVKTVEFKRGLKAKDVLNAALEAQKEFGYAQ